MKPKLALADPDTSPEPEADFLTVDEAANLLRVDRKTLYEAIKLGQVPGVMRVGRTIRIRRADLLGPALTEPPGIGERSSRGNGRTALTENL